MTVLQWEQEGQACSRGQARSFLVIPDLSGTVLKKLPQIKPFSLWTALYFLREMSLKKKILMWK